MHRKYLRQYLRKYWRNAQNTANIGANTCGEKSKNIRTENICANIGATHKIPQILAQIYATKKAEIYAPQIFAQIFTEKKAKNTYGSLLNLQIH